MAILMVDLVRRDFDYGRFCYEKFYTDETAGYLRQGKEYEVCLDFVRMMIKKHDKREEQDNAQRTESVAGDGDGDPRESNNDRDKVTR